MTRRRFATRSLGILSGLLASLLGLLVALVIVLSLMPLDWLRSTINEQVSNALHRPFAIRGELGLDWQRAPGGWLPLPTLRAGDIALGNPADFDVPGDDNTLLVHLERVEAGIAPLALLNQRIRIHRITLTRPNAHLARLADGRNNWTFALGSNDSATADDSAQADAGWTVDIDDIVFNEGRVSYLDATLDADLAVTIDPLGKPVPYVEVVGRSEDDETPAVGAGDPADYVFGWTVTGRYKGEPLEGAGKIGGMLSLRGGDQPFPLQADIRSGTTHVAVAGTLSEPMNFGGLDMHLSFSGQNLGNLYGLTGLVLPDTPPYSTDGHLVARLNEPAGSVFKYNNFNGRIGDSDLHGSLTYTTSQPRPKLTGELTSQQLRFADLAPLIGVNADQQQAEQDDTSAQPADKVLPVSEFQTERWDTMDADVKFTAQRIEHSAALPLSELYAHVVLDNGEILLDPLRFGMAGGSLNTTLRLAGDQTPMQARIDLHARRFQLKQLIPTTDAMRDALGQLNGDATLSGTGNSVAALLGTSDGDVRILVDNGVISRNLMELAGLNVGNYIVGRLFGDEQVRINCACFEDQPAEAGSAIRPINVISA